MNKKLAALMLLMGLVIASPETHAQRIETVDERIQSTYSDSHDINIAQWLRISSWDVRDTEIRNLTIYGQSYRGNGKLEIIANGRMLSSMGFTRNYSSKLVTFPVGTNLDQIFVRVFGEVFVERVVANIVERRFTPAPRPQPPRHEPAPRPQPPRHGPAPRPQPPRHEPAPRPQPPRHEPAPRPQPPRYEPAPRPQPPRHEPAPRPRPGQGHPGPRR